MNRLWVAQLTILCVSIGPLTAYAGPPASCCGEPLLYHFSDERISDQFLPNANSPQVSSDFPELGPNCLGDQLSIVVPVATIGDIGQADLYVNVISEDLDRLFPDAADAAKRGHGIQGWSAGFATDDVVFADINGDTVADGFNSADTAAALNPDWGGVGFGGGSGRSGIKPFPSLFFRATIVDSALNGGQEGVVISFVSCLDGCTPAQFGEFPLEGTESMIRLILDSSGPVMEAGHIGAVRVQEGLRATLFNPPTDAIFTIANDAVRACNRDTNRVELAYQFVPIVDCNNNTIPDEDDIANGTSPDCNNNGVPDECDIANGTSPDCNNNGVPDECDIANGTSPDCNNNGIPDECDISSGVSLDCNNNSIPDECDIASEVSRDCNQNSVPDECDIASGIIQDCNNNGVSDECDVRDGISSDCNSNGIPDACDISTGTVENRDENGVPDECQDPDGDGIFNEVDTAPTQTSNGFSDVVLDGTTAGTVIDFGDQTLLIFEEPNPDGVRVVSESSTGVAAATLDFCSIGAMLSVSAGDEVVVTCGSVMVDTIEGTVELSIPIDENSSAEVVLTAGNSISIEIEPPVDVDQPANVIFTAPETNADEVVVELVMTVVVDGEEVSMSETISVLPGDTTLTQGGGQVPGDFNQDGGFNIADPVRLLNMLFVPATPEFPCEAEGVSATGNRSVLDFNGDGGINIGDPVSALNRLFLASEPHVLGLESECVILRGCGSVCAP